VTTYLIESEFDVKKQIVCILILMASLLGVFVFRGFYVSSPSFGEPVALFGEPAAQFPQAPPCLSAFPQAPPCLSEAGESLREPKESLSLAERKRFETEIDHLFSQKLPHVVDPQRLRPDLMRLNERGIAGVEAILENLRQMPVTEGVARMRMSQVSYLQYRMGWDLDTWERAKSWMMDGMENETLSPVSQAILLADKSELFGGLARSHPNLAAEAISEMPSGVLKQLMEQELIPARRMQ